MSTCPTTCAVVRRFMLLRAALNWVLVLALALGPAVQGVMAAEGLRRAGKDLIAEDMFALFAGFAVWGGYETVPGPPHWMVTSAEGRIEKSLKSPEGLIAYYLTLPKERRARGIFITGEITHLKDPAAAREKMSDYLKTLLANADWMAARTQGIEYLTELCEKEKIDLWVNVTLGAGEQRFRKLTK